VVSIDVDFHGSKIHALKAGPQDGTTVLLLHGARFHSGTWKELGTLQRLGSAGFHALALDLPGFGKSETVDLPPASLLAKLVPVLGINRPVVVAPSMSGRFAYPFVESQAVSGFVPIAPAGTKEHAPKLKVANVPTLIVWGEKDQVFPVGQADLLAIAIKGSRKLILPGANHPCYLDRPKEFHEALIEFLKGLPP
jgi:pimeloyl-ACP methyl ester carboxylesterase